MFDSIGSFINKSVLPVIPVLRSVAAFVVSGLAVMAEL